MNIGQLVSYLAESNLNDYEAQYLSEFVLDLQNDLEKALNDVSRLELEHHLSLRRPTAFSIKMRKSKMK